MGCNRRSQRLAQAGMRQDAMVIHLQQRQWLAESLCALTRRRAAPPPRHHPLPQAHMKPRHELCRRVLAMQDRAVRLIDIAVTGDTLHLAPGLAAGMAIRAKVRAYPAAALRHEVNGVHIDPSASVLPHLKLATR